jgi:hypothetical protein
MNSATERQVRRKEMKTITMSMLAAVLTGCVSRIE